MDFMTITGAVQGFTHLKDLVNTIINEKNEMAVREKVSKIHSEIDGVQAALFQARQDALEIQRERDELVQKVRTFEDWKAVEEKYELVNTVGGAWVYQSKAVPKHFICPACFANKRVIPLQQVVSHSADCPSCDKGYMTGKPEPTRVITNTPGYRF